MPMFIAQVFLTGPSVFRFETNSFQFKILVISQLFG